MAILTAQRESQISGSPVFSAASAGGDKWRNTGREVPWVHNQSGASITVTVAGGPRCRDGFQDPVTFPVAAGEMRKDLMFPVSRHNDVDGFASISYSAVASVSIAIVLQESHPG